MKSLDWKDASETETSSKQNSSLFKASMATPWFGATMLLIGVIVGFVIGNFTSL